MRPSQLVAVAVWAATLARCGDGPVEPRIDQEPGASVSQRTLAANRRRFNENVGSSYTYEYRNICFCGPDTRRHVRVTVCDGARVRVVRVDDGTTIPPGQWSEFLTVAEIFDDIQTAIEEGAASARVDFDESLGYPRDVHIDVDERIADEERGYAVRVLEPSVCSSGARSPGKHWDRDVPVAHGVAARHNCHDVLVADGGEALREQVTSVRFPRFAARGTKMTGELVSRR